MVLLLNYNHYSIGSLSFKIYSLPFPTWSWVTPSSGFRFSLDMKSLSMKLEWGNKARLGHLIPWCPPPRPLRMAVLQSKVTAPFDATHLHDSFPPGSYNLSFPSSFLSLIVPNSYPILCDSPTLCPYLWHESMYTPSVVYLELSMPSVRILTNTNPSHIWASPALIPLSSISQTISKGRSLHVISLTYKFPYRMN